MLKKLMDAYGFSDLLNGQKQAIQSGIFSGKSMVLLMPTGSGKSIIGEWTILDKIRKGGKAIYILPWRAAAAQRAGNIWEKSNNFGIDLKILLAAKRLYRLSEKGFTHVKEGLDNFDILISTPEWVDKILRNSPSIFNKIDLLIFDEIHILRDFQRGSVADKILAWIKTLKPSIQIILMSATISNPEYVSNWLSCKVVRISERPIALIKGIISLEDRTPVWEQETEETKLFDCSKWKIYNRKKLTYKILENLSETTNEEGNINQALVFLNTRNSVRKWANGFAYLLKNRKELFNLPTSKDLEDFNKKMKDSGRPLVSKNFALNLYPNGVGIHTGRMSFETREFMESLFLKGKLRVMFCTSTLSMGINLPARYVIIPFMNIPPKERMTKIIAAQMMGRAGRLGFGDKFGYGLIMTKKSEEVKEAYHDYILSECEPISSTFIRDSKHKNIFDTHILSLFSSPNIMPKILEQTLASFESKIFLSDVNQAKLRLISQGFVDPITNRLTKLGFGTTISMIKVDVALDLYNFVNESQKLPSKQFYAKLIEKLCGMPNGKCIFDQTRLHESTYNDLLQMRLFESASLDRLLKNARLNRTDIGKRDIDLAIQEARRHLRFLTLVHKSTRIQETLDGLRLGIYPGFFWLFKGLVPKQVRKVRRVIGRLDSAGLTDYADSPEELYRFSDKLLQSYGLSHNDIDLIRMRYKQNMIAKNTDI